MVTTDPPITIRVVNAFRHGVDGTQLQQASNNPNVQKVLQREASKRLSTCSNLSEERKIVVTNDANAKPSGSHTETAV